MGKQNSFEQFVFSILWITFNFTWGIDLICNTSEVMWLIGKDSFFLPSSGRYETRLIANQYSSPSFVEKALY